MSNLQEIAARLMELSGSVPVAAAQQLQQQTSEVAAQVANALGDTEMNTRLQQNGSETLAELGNAIALLDGLRQSLQDAAGELINR